MEKLGTGVLRHLTLLRQQDTTKHFVGHWLFQRLNVEVGVALAAEANAIGYHIGQHVNGGLQALGIGQFLVVIQKIPPGAVGSVEIDENNIGPALHAVARHLGKLRKGIQRVAVVMKRAVAVEVTKIFAEEVSRDGIVIYKQNALWTGSRLHQW